MPSLPTNYQKHTSTDASRKFFLRRFNKMLVQKVKNLNVSSVLDAGCGEGFTLSMLSKAHAAKKLEGIDFSKQAIQLGKKQFPYLSLTQGDIYKLPYKDNSFELVICSEVLEHLDMPEKAVREVLRVSKKYVIFSVPNEPFFMGARLAKGMNIKNFGNHPEHINHWTVFSFPQMLKRNGVSVKKVSYPFPWILVLGKK